MRFIPPIFDSEPFKSAPDAVFQPAPSDGVLPDGFFATTNLPTYLKGSGTWRMPAHPRMDGVVRKWGDELEVIEARRVRQGDLIAMGASEDGSAGIFVHADFASSAHAPSSEFRFMTTEVSRERPTNYSVLAKRLREERDRGGFVVWVAGPALVHSRARADMVWMIEQGYVQAMLGGNAIAAHDIEAAIYGTTLGMSDDGVAQSLGHSLHLRAINTVRRLGSIERAIASGAVTSGIMHALVTRKIPYVLAGSIRDDGPLPGVVTDSLAAQDAMRTYATRATGAVLVATALHAIAVGNMLPAFQLREGVPEPLFTICVDQTEFTVNKLRDRGTHQAFGVLTNAQDFMHVLRSHLESL